MAALNSVLQNLFPTRVGVILKMRSVNYITMAFPHVRGGNPTQYTDLLKKECFSPHEWGNPVVFVTRLLRMRGGFSGDILNALETFFTQNRGNNPFSER